MRRKLNTNDANTDYRLLGYFKKETIDNKGDIVHVEYYENYSNETNEYFNLRVRETKTWTRDENTGLMVHQTEKIEWFDGQGTDDNLNKNYEKTFVKFYTNNPEIAYELNREASKRIINKASLFLYASIGFNASKQFLQSIAEEKNLYIDQNKQPLYDAVNNSSLEQIIKTTLFSIINVNYINE